MPLASAMPTGSDDLQRDALRGDGEAGELRVAAESAIGVLAGPLRVMTPLMFEVALMPLGMKKRQRFGDVDVGEREL